MQSADAQIAKYSGKSNSQQFVVDAVSSLRICFLTRSVYGEGGVARVLSLVASGLAERYRVEIVAIGTTGELKYNISPKVIIQSIPDIFDSCFIRKAMHKLNQCITKSPFRHNAKILKLIYVPKKLEREWKSFFDAEQYDVVIALNGREACWLGAIADRIDAKTVAWMHSSFDAYFRTKGSYYYNQDALYSDLIARIDRVIVLNDDTRAKYNKWLKLDSSVLPNPCTFVSNLLPKYESKRFIAIGSLREAKGFDLAIQSFAIASKSLPGWRLDIFGKGTEEETLKRMIKEADMGGKITLCGNTTEVEKELSDSAVYLLSSRWEGMPMCVLEALAVGLPIVAFDIPAMKMLVKDDLEGYLVKACDTNEFARSMVSIATNRQTWERMSEASKHRSTEFSLDTIVSKWSVELEALCGR